MYNLLMQLNTYYQYWKNKEFNTGYNIFDQNKKNRDKDYEKYSYYKVLVLNSQRLNYTN